MELSALFIGIVILAGVAYFVGRPLQQTRRLPKAGAADTLSLETQRDELYTQIKELDMDHATGKVNDEDYTPLRAELVAQAAVVLKQIDGAVAAPTTSAAGTETDDVEAMIAARRKTRSVAVPKPAPVTKSATTAKPVDSDIEAAIAARRKTATMTAPAAACPQCGKPISADDAFCAKCGTALHPQTAR